MSKLETKIAKTIVLFRKAEEGSYEQHRLNRHYLRLWNRYLKQNQIPYNPTLLSELRGNHRLLRSYQ